MADTLAPDPGALAAQLQEVQARILGTKRKLEDEEAQFRLLLEQHQHRVHALQTHKAYLEQQQACLLAALQNSGRAGTATAGSGHATSHTPSVIHQAPQPPAAEFAPPTPYAHVQPVMPQPVPMATPRQQAGQPGAQQAQKMPAVHVQAALAAGPSRLSPTSSMNVKQTLAAKEFVPRAAHLRNQPGRDVSPPEAASAAGGVTPQAAPMQQASIVGAVLTAAKPPPPGFGTAALAHAAHGASLADETHKPPPAPLARQPRAAPPGFEQFAPALFPKPAAQSPLSAFPIPGRPMPRQQRRQQQQQEHQQQEEQPHKAGAPDASWQAHSARPAGAAAQSPAAALEASDIAPQLASEDANSDWGSGDVIAPMEVAAVAGCEQKGSWVQGTGTDSVHTQPDGGARDRSDAGPLCRGGVCDQLHEDDCSGCGQRPAAGAHAALPQLGEQDFPALGAVQARTNGRGAAPAADGGAWGAGGASWRDKLQSCSSGTAVAATVQQGQQQGPAKSASSGPSVEERELQSGLRVAADDVPDAARRRQVRRQVFEHSEVHLKQRRKINVLEGLELLTGVMTPAEQAAAVQEIERWVALGRTGWLRGRTFSAPKKWLPGKGRVTMQFGCCYNYAEDAQGRPPGIIPDEIVEPLPPLLRALCRRLVRWGVLPAAREPNTAIINIYEPGDCIPPHVDHFDFVRPFCTLSLLSEQAIVFAQRLVPAGPGRFEARDGCTPARISLPTGSCLVLKGTGGDYAMHCVPPVEARRISITLRRMAPEHDAACRQEIKRHEQLHGPLHGFWEVEDQAEYVGT